MYCLFCVVLCIVCAYMCIELLPPGGHPIAVKYIISFPFLLSHPYMGTRGTFPGVQQPGHEVDHLLPFTARVKNV